MHAVVCVSMEDNVATVSACAVRAGLASSVMKLKRVSLLSSSGSSLSLLSWSSHSYSTATVRKFKHLLLSACDQGNSNRNSSSRVHSQARTVDC